MKKTLVMAIAVLCIFSACKKGSVSLPAVDQHGSFDLSMNNKNYHLNFATIGKDPNSNETIMTATDGVNTAFSFVFTGAAGTYNFGNGIATNTVNVVARNLDNATYVSIYEDCTSHQTVTTTGTMTISSWADVNQNIKGTFSGNLATVNGSCASGNTSISGSFNAVRLN